MIVRYFDKQQIIVQTLSQSEETFLKGVGFNLNSEEERLFLKKCNTEQEVILQLEGLTSVQARFLDSEGQSPKCLMLNYQQQGIIKKDFVTIFYQANNRPLIKCYPYSKINCPKKECLCKKCGLNSGPKCLGCRECDEHKVPFSVTDCENFSA